MEQGPSNIEKALCVQLHGNDNVAVALYVLKKGDEIWTEAGSLLLLDDIPTYFKVALKDIPAGDKILKYGMCIGTANENISRGQLVHSHNIKSNYF